MDFGQGTFCEQWLRFCHGDQTEKKMELYWIMRVGANVKTVQGDFVILFEDLESDFPALKHLVLE